MSVDVAITGERLDEEHSKKKNIWCSETPPAVSRILKCKTKCQTHAGAHTHVHTPRTLNICCGCRRSRFIWKTVSLSTNSNTRIKTMLKVTPKGPQTVRFTFSPWGLVFSLPRRSSSNQTRCHMQMYSNSMWLCIIHYFLLTTTGATWITLVLDKRKYKYWQQQQKVSRAGCENSPIYKPAKHD